MVENKPYSFSTPPDKTPRTKAGFFKSCFALFFVVFFFPIGLFLMWRWNVWGRIGTLVVTGICALFFLLLIVASLEDPGTTPNSTEQKTRVSVPNKKEELKYRKGINDAALKLSMQIQLEKINEKLGKPFLKLSHTEVEEPGVFDKGSLIAVIIISDVWYQSQQHQKERFVTDLATIWKKIITDVDPNDERDPVIWLLDVRNKNVGSFMLGIVNIG